MHQLQRIPVFFPPEGKRADGADGRMDRLGFTEWLKETLEWKWKADWLPYAAG
ncbi:hypothetical protein D3C71_2136790 [compost metagenome]